MIEKQGGGNADGVKKEEAEGDYVVRIRLLFTLRVKVEMLKRIECCRIMRSRSRTSRSRDRVSR